VPGGSSLANQLFPPTQFERDLVPATYQLCRARAGGQGSRLRDVFSGVESGHGCRERCILSVTKNKEDKPVRFIEAELSSAAAEMPNPWGLVKRPEGAWGHLSRHGHRLLKELLEGTMELRQDEWVQVEWHRPTAERKTHRSGYYSRKRWPTVRVTPQHIRMPRCRARGLPGRRLTGRRITAKPWGNPWWTCCWPPLTCPGFEQVRNVA
jgi:hypothetical protein